MGRDRVFYVPAEARAAGHEEQAMGWVGRLLIAVTLPAMLAGAARAETPAMTAPPRQQGDVTAILDQQKPDPAAAAGAGAEAASGLGRAFFYAGTRALLVTNWSVHSASARELISDLFRRQSADPQLPRAEALRQAMMAMLNGPGFVDETGKTLFAYAHPLFWAPYSILGDGSGN